MELDNLSIGILLCAEKDSLEVEYALRIANKPIGVAEFLGCHCFATKQCETLAQSTQRLAIC